MQLIISVSGPVGTTVILHIQLLKLLLVNEQNELPSLFCIISYQVQTCNVHLPDTKLFFW